MKFNDLFGVEKVYIQQLILSSQYLNEFNDFLEKNVAYYIKFTIKPDVKEKTTYFLECDRSLDLIKITNKEKIITIFDKWNFDIVRLKFTIIEKLPPFLEVLFDCTTQEDIQLNRFKLAPIETIEQVTIETDEEQEVILLSAPTLHGTTDISMN